MTVSYEADVIADGNHASILIPERILHELGANKRATLKVTVNGHTYRSTAVGVQGECRVVFPSANRVAAQVKAGDRIMVKLELESGHRVVELPADLVDGLAANSLTEIFEALTYSKRKEFARQVAEAKAAETRLRRIAKVLESVKEQNRQH